MSNKQIATNLPKKNGGGTAVGGGANFQANVTAIVGVHILCHTPLEWLANSAPDTPIAVWSESEGPGDDLKIELANSKDIEVQVKKGLSSGDRLWDALLPMAKAINDDSNDMCYGVLVVCPNSSKPVRQELANDLLRLGQGRTDFLTDIGKQWHEILLTNKIAVEKACSGLSIKVIHALQADNNCITTAKRTLTNICVHQKDVDRIYKHIYNDAISIMEHRGRWSTRYLLKQLHYLNIQLRTEGHFVTDLLLYIKWIIDTNKYYSVIGFKHEIPSSQLLPMGLEVLSKDTSPVTDPEEALETYAKRHEQDSYFDQLDGRWIARFKKQVVVEAGPGIGKSTLLSQLAYHYAQDGYIVLKVALYKVAINMQNGTSFTEALLKHALDGAPIKDNYEQLLSSPDCVILADGLDECGKYHHDVAEQINKYATGHPNSRIVVTTRPIGYETEKLSLWPHYRLLAPSKDKGKENLELLVKALNGVSLSQKHIEKIIKPSDAIANSPLLLGMSAVLIYNQGKLLDSRRDLYAKLFELYEQKPTIATDNEGDYSTEILDIIGWELINNPFITFSGLISSSSKILAELTDLKPLALKKHVELAISHWERVGLLEKVYVEGTPLITFIHKTFCEFAASRYLAQHVKYTVNLIDEILSKPAFKEVIYFAVAHGFDKPLIHHYISKANQGDKKQLVSALELVENPDTEIGEQLKQELLEEVFTAIDQNVENQFSMGMKLVSIGKNAPHLVIDFATSRLKHENSAIRLIATAIAVNCDPSTDDAATLMNLFEELLPIVKPADVNTNVLAIINKTDRCDKDLLQSIALITLRRQTDENIRDFALWLHKESNLVNLGCHLEINEILVKRGIKEIPLNDDEDEDERRGLFQVPITSQLFNPNELGYKVFNIFSAIAETFVTSEQIDKDKNYPKRHLVQFAAFLEASRLLKRPANEEHSWTDADKQYISTIFKITAEALSLDLAELKNDAQHLLNCYKSETFSTIYKGLPRVDIDEPDWGRVKSIKINKAHITQGLIHSSTWINELAANICVFIDISLKDLENLLQRTGAAMYYVIELIRYKYPKQLTTALYEHLEAKPDGDISALFSALLMAHKADLAIGTPSPNSIKIIMSYLLADENGAVCAAAELLSYYLDNNIELDTDALIAVVDNCKKDDFEVGDSLQELKNKLPLIKGLN